MPAYQTWTQVAGYFDGDGTIGFSDLSNDPCKLGISLVFTDQSVEQIANVKGFGRVETTDTTLREPRKAGNS